MKKISLLFIFALVLSGCEGESHNSSSTSSSGTYKEVDPNASNVAKITVESTSTFSNVNIPFVSVTIAVPGSDTTVTIDHVLVDTGSTGLRLLKSQIGSLSFGNVYASDGGALCEAVTFMDGTATWGEVVYANVTIGGESASSVPVQLISNTYPIPQINGESYTNCVSQNGDLDGLGCNGILGVGLDVDDSGAGYYFSCSSKTSSSYTELTGSSSITAYVTNPVTMFSVDNNGLIVDLPSVSDSGAVSLTGYLIFGIGTQTNNQTDGMTVYTTDSNGYFTTTYKSASKPYSFLDTGSNGIYFDDGSITSSKTYSGFYAPTSTLTLSATNTGANSVTGSVTFKVGNVNSMNGSNSVLPLLCGKVGSSLIFDWGLPFFFGKQVFVAISGKKAGSSTGPYWAY
jgi:hypothetical protein